MQLFLYTASMKMTDFLVPIIRKTRLIRCHFIFPSLQHRKILTHHVFVFFLVLIKCPSCTAAKVATTAIITIGINDSTKNVTGIPTKSRNPVTLFAMVCGKTHFLYITTAEIWFMTFIKTINNAQIQIQFGSVNAGISLMQQQATKTMSAKLSNSAPVLLSQWSFRAK